MEEMRESLNSLVWLGGGEDGGRVHPSWPTKFHPSISEMMQLLSRL